MSDRLMRLEEVLEMSSISRSELYRQIAEWTVPQAGQGRVARRALVAERGRGMEGRPAANDHLVAKDLASQARCKVSNAIS